MADAYEVVRLIQAEIFGKGKVELIDELVHETFVNHTPLPGTTSDREGLKAEVEMLHAAVSEAEGPAERILVDGPDVAWRWRFTGVHTGEFMGIPASGNRVDMTGNDLGVMRDGRLAEWWSETDMLVAMTQLGVMESPFG